METNEKTRNAELPAELDMALSELPRLISTFEQEEIDIVPFEGSWTAGQLAEHMIKANSGFVELLNGQVEETGGAHDGKVEGIKGVFLDFDTKLNSPEFVLPLNTSHQKEELLQSLEEIRAGAKNAVETLDLTKTCTGLKLPQLGFLTRLEALYFVLYHTQRHIRQLKNIRDKISALSS